MRQLTQQADVDESRPSIEFYRRRDVIELLLRLNDCFSPRRSAPQAPTRATAPQAHARARSPTHRHARRMHLHPRAALPLVQLQRPSTGRHPEMPMTTSSAASELALAPNDKTTTAAFLSWRARSGTGRSARSRRVRSDRVPSAVAGTRRGRRCSSSCVASSSAPSLPVWREPRTCTGSARRSLFSDAGVRELPEQAARPVLMYARGTKTEVASASRRGLAGVRGYLPVRVSSLPTQARLLPPSA